MNNYFRVITYWKEENATFILDSNGKFNLLWEFCNYLKKKGLEIIDFSDMSIVIDINIKPVEESTEQFFLRASQKGKPDIIEQEVNGKKYKAFKVADKIYIPNKNLTI